MNTITRQSFPAIVACLIFLGSTKVLAQNPIINLSFTTTEIAKNKTITEASEATYSVDLMKPQFTSGITDYALDLSSDAMLRRPWIVDSLSIQSIDFAQSFSIQLFVKTKPGARQGTPIAGNKLHDSLTHAGWQILTQTNGAWGINLADGKKQINYLPTERQAINDGFWHQIVLTVERPKNEARMYFDGRQVAIYNLLDLGHFLSDKRTIIGGTDQYFEWGSAGQWKAFNGYIDEVKIWNRTISVQEVEHNWNTLCPKKKTSARRLPPNQIKVMTWNIWHGGRRYGQYVGVDRTIETIKAAQVDVICMIETYGSGPIIADALGYHLYLISSNLSILSKYPLGETFEAFRPFNFGGAYIQISTDQKILVLDTWLHYLPSYLANVAQQKVSAKELVEAEFETRANEIQQILKEIQPTLARSGAIGTIMAGDFNSGSHLDWTNQTKDIHHQYVVDWPVSMSMAEAGFKDSFRILHINPLTDPGFTWTPRAAKSSTLYGPRDRIDYIYFQGKLDPIHSEVLSYHPIMFPSDHAAVITTFGLP
ncbi:MAG: hypothetical protein HKN87_23405 [Saprospiraceae bacterium]|nr:hypothetical protein [Saprospiraceae bacterium]